MAYRSDLPHTTTEQNPVQTAGTIVGTVTSLLVALSAWGIDALDLPTTVQIALSGFAVVVAGLIGGAVGRYFQRYTEPAYIVDEIVRARMDASPVDPAEGTDGL